MKNKKINSKNRARGRPPKKLSTTRVKSMHRSNSKKRVIKQHIRKNRPLHKRIMLHPITLLFALAIGVFVFEWTYQVVADSISITATVPAAAITTPAVITTPTDGFTFNTQNILVEGYCPDGSYINVYDNDLFAGTSMCTTGGTFQLELSLYLGSNVLIARSYNVTNQPGPDSSAVNVTYEVAEAAGTTTTPPTVTPPVTSPILPLLVVSNFQYQTFAVNNTFSWQIQIKGGTLPVTVTINWGDGKSSQYTTDAHGYLIIKHTFSTQGYYPVVIKATDANGNSHILQLAALIRNPNAANIYSTNYVLPAPTATGLIKFFESIKTWLWVAWPSLLIVGLMIISFWLGERQEYRDAVFRYRHKA
jgi:hypothetical protein